MHTLNLTGSVIQPGDPAYDENRTIFNAMIDRRPSVIAQCLTPADVTTAIDYAREHQLEIAVRGGGHSVAGASLTDGGLVVDLRRMNAVTVDPAARTARVSGGSTMGDLDRACQPFSLATTGGRVSTTGVTGLTLSGGGGWLDRKFGLACDNLLEVELITADGKTVTANENENPELFWALHGGGGNFGVATSLTLRLHPLPAVTAALLMWPGERGPEILTAFRALFESASDDAGGGFIYLTGPEAPFVPPELVNQQAAAVFIAYTGKLDEAREVIAPLLDLRPLGEMVAEMPYAEMQSMLDDPPGMRNYWSAEYLHSLPDDAVEAFSECAATMLVPSPSQHMLAPQGGAVAGGPTGYPVPWRSAAWIAHPFGMWTDPADDERGRAWVHEVRAAMRPWATGDVYLNFIGDEGRDRVVAGFGTNNYQRLVEIKREYDPQNVLHLNHNINPG
jgi:FAD/FMN-containing dehydrogenase